MRHILLTALAALSTLAPCHAHAQAKSPLGDAFVPLLQIAPDFEARAKALFPRGLDYEGDRIVFNCAGKAPRRFSFEEDDRGDLKIVASKWEPYARVRGQIPPELHERLKNGDAVPSGVDPLAEGHNDPHFGFDEKALADFIRVKNGWILAFEFGERGGHVVWLPDKDFCTRCKAMRLSFDAGNDLFQAEPDLVFSAEGSDAHGIFVDGSIGTFVRDPVSGFWSPKEVRPKTQAKVRTIHARQGVIAGATVHGPVVVDRDGVVRYNTDTNPGKYVQSAGSVFILKDESILIGGRDTIAVYEPGSMRSTLYAPRDCNVEFQSPGAD